MTSYKQGDVLLLVRYPQTNLEREMRRPALVVADTGDEDILVARITSERRKGTYDYEIKGWEEAGLVFPSVVRVHKMTTLSKTFVKRKLGEITPKSMAQIKQAIKILFGV